MVQRSPTSAKGRVERTAFLQHMHVNVDHGIRHGHFSVFSSSTCTCVRHGPMWDGDPCGLQPTPRREETPTDEDPGVPFPVSIENHEDVSHRDEGNCEARTLRRGMAMRWKPLEANPVRGGESRGPKRKETKRAQAWRRLTMGNVDARPTCRMC